MLEKITEWFHFAINQLRQRYLIQPSLEVIGGFRVRNQDSVAVAVVRGLDPAGRKFLTKPFHLISKLGSGWQLPTYSLFRFSKHQKFHNYLAVINHHRDTIIVGPRQESRTLSANQSLIAQFGEQASQSLRSLSRRGAGRLA
jgi:hypothetical protein